MNPETFALKLDDDQKEELLNLIGYFLIKHFPLEVRSDIETQITFTHANKSDTKEAVSMTDAGGMPQVASMSGRCVTSQPGDLICGPGLKYKVS